MSGDARHAGGGSSKRPTTGHGGKEDRYEATDARGERGVKVDAAVGMRGEARGAERGIVPPAGSWLAYNITKIMLPGKRAVRAARGNVLEIF